MFANKSTITINFDLVESLVVFLMELSNICIFIFDKVFGGQLVTSVFTMSGFVGFITYEGFRNHQVTILRTDL